MCLEIPQIFPELRTERFLLRRILASDKQKIFEGLSDENVIRYYGVSYKTIEDTQLQMDWFENLLSTSTGIWWAICEGRETDLIGTCGFNNLKAEHRKAEIGFWLLPQNWNKGIMTEAAGKIIDYAFSHLKLHRLEAVIEPGNMSSKNLVEKLGFGYEGTMRDSEIKNGHFIDLEYYSLLNAVPEL